MNIYFPKKPFEKKDRLRPVKTFNPLPTNNTKKLH